MLDPSYPDSSDRPSSEPVRGVFFDAGWTLVEPTRPVTEIYHQMAGDLGIDLDPTPFAEHLRSAWRDLNSGYRQAHPELRTSESAEREAWLRFTRRVAEPFPKLLQRHTAWHAKLVDWFDSAAAWRVLPTVETTLDRLAARRLRLAVVSNWHSALHGILADLGLKDRFEWICPSSEAGFKKPHPQIFLAGCQRMELAPARVIHVGDSWDEDILGAAGAGLRAVHVVGTPSPVRPGSAPQPAQGNLSPQISQIPEIHRLEELLDLLPDAV